METTKVTDTAEVFSKSQLDEELVHERPFITIKDSKLGNRTILWIRFGRCLNGMTLATAIGSVICSTDVYRGVNKYGKPLAICSVLMCIGYRLLWSPSPLMGYKIKQGPNICTIMKGEYHPTTKLIKQETPTKNFRTVACIVAIISAFWNDVISYDYKAAVERLRHIEKKEVEQTQQSFVEQTHL